MTVYATFLTSACSNGWYIPLFQKSHSPDGQLLHCHLISESHKETFSIFISSAFISKTLETFTEAPHYNPIDSLSPKINKSLTHCRKCCETFHIHAHTLLHLSNYIRISLPLSHPFYLFKMGKVICRCESTILCWIWWSCIVKNISLLYKKTDAELKQQPLNKVISIHANTTFN